tara:strand:- start:122 stop:391 length:270 start_codon:yes stop_codon:yes gene_type:complete
VELLVVAVVVAVALSLTVALALCRPSAPRCLGSKVLGLRRVGACAGRHAACPTGGGGESHLNARRTFVVVISELDVQPYHRPLCLPHAG